MDAAALYTRPLGQFVGARAELAKSLRAAGERAQAAEVAALRRPTVAAWALDQVAARAPELITGLLGAGTALREAVDRALRGDASSLRRAETGERAAVDAVLARAASEAGAAGVTINDSHRQRMATTLRAAVLDAEVAAALRAGTLDRDHEAPALGFVAGAEVVPPAIRPKPRPATGEERARRAELDQLGKQVARLSQRAERLHHEAEDAAQHATELRARAKEAAVAARTAERQLRAAERPDRSKRAR
jgi:hypothetical protein